MKPAFTPGRERTSPTVVVVALCLVVAAALVVGLTVLIVATDRRRRQIIDGGLSTVGVVVRAGGRSTGIIRGTLTQVAAA